MNTKDTGNISEAIILAALVKKGYKVFQPFGDNTRYDLVADIDGIFVRIQCKTARIYNGTYTFSTSSVYSNSNGNLTKLGYDKKDIDCFMVVFNDSNKIFLIDVVEVGSTEVKLRFKAPKRLGLQGTIRWAKDYEFKDFGKVLKRLKRAAC